MVVKRKKKFWVVGATVAVAVTLGMTTTGCSFKSKGTSKTSDYVAEDVKNKIIYQKNGGLYYADLKEDKEPALIYDSGNADSRYTCKYTNDGKYFYFFNDTDEAKNLYQVDVGKLTFSEEKNKKNLKIVSSDISMEEQSHYADFELVDTDTLVYENEKDHGVYLYNGKENQLLAKDASFSANGVIKGTYLLYKQEDKENYLKYDLKSGNSSETNIPKEAGIGQWSDKDGITYTLKEDDFYKNYYWTKDGNDLVPLAMHVNENGDGVYHQPGITDASSAIDNTDGIIIFFKDREQDISYYDFVEDPYAEYESNYDNESYDENDYGDDEDDDEDDDDEDDDEDYNYGGDDYDYGDDGYDYGDDDGYDYGEDDGYDYGDNDGYDYGDEEDDDYNDESDIEYLRKELRKTIYSRNNRLRDLYCSDKDSGENLVAEGVVSAAYDAKNKICIYQKVNLDQKICGIDEITTVSEFEERMKEQPPEFKAYAYVDGVNQELSEISSGETIETGGIKSSEDGKWYVISVGDGTEDGNNQLMMFEKTSEGLKKTDFTAKNTNLGLCSWEGNDLYYYENGNYCKYSNGKSSVIFENASGVEQQPDGIYLLDDQSNGKDVFSLADKNLHIQPIESKLIEASHIYIDSKCILYLAKNEDGEGTKLYLYTGGKENRLIDSDVQFCWCNGEYDK